MRPRDLVAAKIRIAGRKFELAVAVTDPKDMKYHMIVSIDILVDPSKDGDSESDARPPVRPATFK